MFVWEAAENVKRSLMLCHLEDRRANRNGNPCVLGERLRAQLPGAEDYVHEQGQANLTRTKKP
jgi:hypothetical protein